MKTIAKALCLLTIAAAICIPVRPQEPVEWVPVAGSDVNLRSGPSVDSRIVGTISYGKSVRIVRRLDQTVNIAGVSGRWTLVQLPESSTALWVLDYYLAMPDHFALAENIPARAVQFCIGDYCPHMVFASDGTVTISQAICLGAPCTSEQKRHLCAQQNGRYLERDPAFWNSESCTTVSRAKVYRDVYSVSGGVFIIFQQNNRFCVIPEHWNSCAND